MNEVSPSEKSPASRTALFTCALATSDETAPARSLPPGRTSTGGRPLAPVATSAPSSRSGLATRSIGRRESDASPISVAWICAPASSPVKSRMVVPELPQSRGPVGSSRPASPAPSTMASSRPMSGSRAGSLRAPSGREGAMKVRALSSAGENALPIGSPGIHGVPSPRRIGTPSCARQRVVERTSPPRASPAIRLSPSAMAARISARCEMLLSPGTRSLPPALRSGCSRGWMRTRMADS